MFFENNYLFNVEENYQSINELTNQLTIKSEQQNNLAAAGMYNIFGWGGGVDLKKKKENFGRKGRYGRMESKNKTGHKKKKKSST